MIVKQNKRMDIKGQLTISKIRMGVAEENNIVSMKEETIKIIIGITIAIIDRRVDREETGNSTNAQTDSQEIKTGLISLMAIPNHIIVKMKEQTTKTNTISIPIKIPTNKIIEITKNTETAEMITTINKVHIIKNSYGIKDIKEIKDFKEVREVKEIKEVKKIKTEGSKHKMI